jgi:hypothetical protein
MPAWERFASLVLEAAYEATLLAALECPRRGGRPRVYLTLLGGGAFGRQREWILRAIRRALGLHRSKPIGAASARSWNARSTSR